MDNIDAPNGFAPYSMGSEGAPAIRYYQIKSGNSAIKQYSMVKLGEGGVDLWSSGAFIGVAAEAKPASSTGLIAVYDDPQQRFVAQTDNGTGTGTVVTAIGKNATAIAESSTGLISNQEIDENSVDTTATLPWKIVGLARYADNAFGEFNKLIVVPNNHQLSGGTGTAGV